MARLTIGRPSFRPMLESLENREMMDAGFGHGLQIPLAQPTGGNQLALVRQLASETTQQVNHVVGSAMQTAQQVNQFVHSALETAQTAYSAARNAAIDQMFAGLGHQSLPQGVPQSLRPGQQISHSVQEDSEYVTQRAQKFLKDNIIGDSFLTNRWMLKPETVSHGETKVEGNRIYVTFSVAYPHYSPKYEERICSVNFIFEGKNTGGVKQYDLVGAGLDKWTGWDFVGKQFEAVAKELFRNKVSNIECQRFDENTFANNVLRQTEKIYGAKAGTFQLNKVERLDGGIRILMYTDNKPFNPDSGIGRGELWLGFNCNDANITKGFVKVSEIHQGYWSSGKWTITEIDRNALYQMVAADWKVRA